MSKADVLLEKYTTALRRKNIAADRMTKAIYRNNVKEITRLTRFIIKRCNEIDVIQAQRGKS